MKFSFRNLLIIVVTAIFAGSGLLAAYNATAVKAKASIDYVSITLGDPPQQADLTPPSLDIRFEPSGTHVDSKGNLKIRLDFYPGPEDKSYAQQHVYVVDESSPEYLAGYPGEVDKDGNPVDEIDYQKWIDDLPHVWRTNPCLCHFLTVKPDITLAELDSLVKSMFPSSVTATIDDSASKVNSAHLLSPYMRDKTVTSATKVDTREDKALLAETVNARLAEYQIGGQTSGQTEKITPGSIDIGAAATDRAATTSISLYTLVAVENRANATGTLDTIEIWAASNVSDCEVATFDVVSGNNLSTIDTHTIGNFSSGSKQTFSGITGFNVNLNDYIGIHASGGTIERDSTGSGYWYYGGDSIPCTNLLHSISSDRTMSLYGTGTESASYDISNSPSSKAFGVVAANTTYYAYGSAPSNPVADGECTFTVTNNGSQCDIDIHGHAFSGGVGWTLTSGAPGENTVRITAYYSGQNPASGIVVTISDQEFISALAASATKKWDFKLETGTFTDGSQKTAVLTLTARAP